MAGPVATSGCPSFPTVASSTSHGADSYTLLLYALFGEPTDVARCMLGFDTHAPALPSVSRSQKRPVWCTGTGSRRVAQSPNLGISSVPLVADRVSLFSRSPILFQLQPSGGLSDCLSRLPFPRSRERLIDFPCHPELVQQYRQLARHRHHGPLFGFLFPPPLDPLSELLQPFLPRLLPPYLLPAPPHPTPYAPLSDPTNPPLPPP